MHSGLSTAPFAISLLTALMLAVSAADGGAQSHDSHGPGTIARDHIPTRDENALVEAVRDATRQFKNVTSVDGPGHGYELMFGCVSGGDFGAMGLHYVNPGLIDGEIKRNEPEIIIFEPTPDGGIRITGVDYLTPVAAWAEKHKGEGPPMLDGQLFHLFDSPNRFGLDPFYTLHVWAWKDNPNGTFTNWNPNVSCDAFNQKDTQ